MRVSNPGATIEVTQADETRLHVTVAHVDHEPHYVAIPHGDVTTVWAPASGLHLHVTGILVSVEAAGAVTLYRDDDVVAVLHFNEKRAVPIPIIEDMTFDADEILKALYVGDTGDPQGHITALGHEDP